MQATFESHTRAFIEMPPAFTGIGGLSPNAKQLFHPVPSKPSFGGDFLPDQQIDAESYLEQYSQTPRGVSGQISSSSFHEYSGEGRFEVTVSKTCDSGKTFRTRFRAATGGRVVALVRATGAIQVKDGKSTIDLGGYTLDLNKKDSSISLTNKKTGEKTRIWGDPHIDTNGTSGMFKGPMTFDLPDGTKVTVGTQSQGNVSYADNVTITRGNDAYVVRGLSEKDSNPLTVQRERNGRQLDAETPDGYSLVANRNGKGWIDPQTGRAPTAADFSKH
jgi:hypothetical protein